MANPIDWAKDKAGDVIGGAANSVAGSAIDKFAEAVSHAVGESVKSVATIWTKVPTVGLGPGETASKLQDNLFWFVGFAAVLSVIIAGARMAWEARAQPLRELGQSLMTLVLVTGGGLALVNLAVTAGDEFSTWLIGGSGGEDFNKKMTAMLAAVITTGPLGAMLVILVGLILILASIAQIVLMIARSGMLVLLAGILPLAGAATNTEWGKQWFQKTAGWMIAFILYKPAAALVYAAAFELFGDSKDLMGALTGMTMMVLAVAALPALMKLCVPLVGSLSGGGGGGGGAMAAGAMASQSIGGGPTGAISQPSQSPASMGTQGARGSAGPSGAAPSGSGSTIGAGSVGAGGSAASGGGAAAVSGGGTAATGAGAAAGPVGAGVAVATQAVSKGKEAANEAAGDGGPDGSK